MYGLGCPGNPALNGIFETLRRFGTDLDNLRDGHGTPPLLAHVSSHGLIAQLLTSFPLLPITNSSYCIRRARGYLLILAHRTHISWRFAAEKS